MRYIDFVDRSYVPEKNDLICEFLVEPNVVSIEVAAGGIAAESSIGTWTELTTSKPHVEKISAKVFEIIGKRIRVAYPDCLFEPGNMPNILSSIAGNVFGLGALKNVRLDDVFFPAKVLENFKGPSYGISGIRELLGVEDRPLIGTIIKPKLGLRPEEHAKIAYEAWVGGCDLVKDDENLANQSFNPFEERVAKTLEMRRKAEKECGVKKGYLANVTSGTSQMIKRTQFVEDNGGRYVMIDILTAGFAALQALRDQDLNIVIHGHRAGHAALTKNFRHGISMRTLAKVSRIIGVDQLHVGSSVGKMSETKKDVLDNIVALKMAMNGLKPVLPVASGGLHPKLVPALLETFGKDFVIQAGGGIHGHRQGTIAGAKAMRQAVDGTLKGISLSKLAETQKELQIALETWN
ncbi:MAG: type III ribulose-bisphosphate carboxylase [Candidatus Bathyarchaeota archaeon]|nr:type III ribulose-bisphosphate carboxylase [Candidatus Bathyarchaeota archaeon]